MGWEVRDLPPIAKAIHDVVFGGDGVNREEFMKSEAVLLYVDRDKFNKNVSVINKLTGKKGMWDYKVCMVRNYLFYHKNF